MLARKVFLASAVLSGGRLLARVLDLVAALIVARFLSPADFGVVTLATTVLMILRALTELPVSEALIRTKELSQDDIDTAFTLSFLRGLIVALLLAALAWPMAAIYDDARLAGLMLALTAAPLAMGLRSPRLVQFSREVNYTPETVIDTAAKLVAFALSVAVAWQTRSYWALVIALALPPLIATPASYFVAPYRPRLCLASTRSIVAFAGWITLARFVATANGEADRFFIAGILGKASLGFFAMGRSVATTATWAIGMPLMQAMYPGFAKLQDQPDRLRAAYLKGQAMLVACLMPLGLALAILADPLVRLVLGPQWLPLVPVIQVFAPVGALASVTMPVHALVLAMGMPRQLLVRDVVMFVLGLPAVIAGAYWFGMMGAVWARMATGLVHTLLNLQIIGRTLHVPIWRQLANFWRSATSACVMAAMMLAVGGTLPAAADTLHQIAHLLLGGAAGGFAYVAAHALLWLLAGQPGGPEVFVRDGTQAVLRRLRKVTTTP